MSGTNHITYALYDSANKRYLRSGHNNAAMWETTDNVLLAHMYETDGAAERRGALILESSLACAKEYPKIVKDQNIKPFVLKVVKVYNPTIVEMVTVNKPPSKNGFAIRIKHTVKKGHENDTFVVRGEDYFYKLPYTWSAEFDRTPTKRFMNEITCRGGKPKVWKTEAGAQQMLDRIKGIKVESGHFDYTMEVVPYNG